MIRFVELFDKVGFRQAVNQLSGISSQLPAGTWYGKSKQKSITPRQIKLIARVVDFYHKAFCEDPRAKEYLAGRGIRKIDMFSSYKIGFANGTLLNLLPDDGDLIEDLQEIGLLNGKKNEHFYGCVTFPLYDAGGSPAGIYGRRINDMDKGGTPLHLYLPGPRQAAKSHKEIILTESVIDSVTLICAGFRNTIPCCGTNGLAQEHLSLFKQYNVNTVYICFDADESGKK